MSINLQYTFKNHQRIMNKIIWIPHKDDWITLNTYGMVKHEQKMRYDGVIRNENDA